AQHAQCHRIDHGRIAVVELRQGALVARFHGRDGGQIGRDCLSFGARQTLILFLSRNTCAAGLLDWISESGFGQDWGNRGRGYLAARNLEPLAEVKIPTSRAKDAREMGHPARVYFIFYWLSLMASWRSGWVISP